MPDGGTGQKFTRATTVVAGVASLSATLLSAVSIWLQAKNYRKPLLQRYVVRILLMVPIYSIASWTSMISLTTAAFLDPVRDIYEAFTIYTFFQLLINYLGGERSLIIMTHGRAPVQHLWPLNHVLRKVDISDPHTFLSIKRGILQYAWLKPLLALATVIMKATGTYQDGYIGPKSGYFWSGIIYNISVTVSLYSLGLFWVCMHRDLQPFRPVPKFLCIKLIIFASYWQGFFLSLLVWLGAIPDQVEGYTRDNLAAAIQDALICLEMPAFAIAHWYAFSWHDFADNRILSARMPLSYALRDAFGIKDLMEDSKETFRGSGYGYRAFDSGDKVMAHQESESRLARLQEGMRYERGGRGKYWIPKPGEVSASSPLLGSSAGPSSGRPEQATEANHGTFEELRLDAEEERLYLSARRLEFGDWNYPVITANEPLRDRYRWSFGSADVEPLSAPSPRASAPHPSAPSTAARRERGRQPAAAAEPAAVVTVKAKKTAKKKSAADPRRSNLGRASTGPQDPASALDVSARGRNAGSSSNAAGPRRQHDDAAWPCQTPQSDEFRNVWSDGRRFI